MGEEGVGVWEEEVAAQQASLEVWRKGLAVRQEQGAEADGPGNHSPPGWDIAFRNPMAGTAPRWGSQGQRIRSLQVQ